MKKLLSGLLICFLALTILPSKSFAQIYFNEDFDGIGGPTAGGAGTYSFPAGWLKFNVDNLTPAGSVSYVNEAWERREDFANNVADSAAFSTSWYSPAGTANDWMWTPAITVLPNSILKWNGLTYDPSYPDGYEVRIKTGAAPTLANQATSATAFSIAAENTTWTARNVSLSAYSGQTIYIGFRNNSTDEFLLLIDDVQVEQQIMNDGQMFATTDVSEYTIMPVTQCHPLTLSGTIRNNGMNTLNNVYMQVNVYDGALGTVYTANSPTQATLATGTNANFSVPSFTPTAADFYTVEYISRHSAVDPNQANDTLYQGILVDDSTFARDDGTVTGTLGIGSGTGGILGQMFQSVSTDTLTSLTFFISNAGDVMSNQEIYGEVWAYNNGKPTTLIARTDTVVCDTSSDQVITIAIANNILILPADSFYVGIMELDSNITLGTATNNFLPNVTHVDFPYGTGTWSNNEDYGFNNVYVLRSNFGTPCPNFSVNILPTDANCNQSDGAAAAIPVNEGPGAVGYLWSNGGTTQNITNIPAGNYSVTLTNGYGCATVGNVNVANNNGPAVDSLYALDALCNGDNGSAVVIASGGTSPYSYSWSNGDTTSTINDVAGTYSVTVTDVNGCVITAGPVTVSEPTALGGSISSTEESAPGANDGTATVTASGGTAPYTYAWSNGATTATATGLTAGTYTVTVTDANGCTFTSSTSVATFIVKGNLLPTNLVNLFPNPNHGVFTVTVDLDTPTDISLEVFDVEGKKIYSSLTEDAVDFSQEINLGDVSEGNYLLKITAGSRVTMRKLVVQ